MPDELTFMHLLNFLSDRRGQKVYVEIGTPRPRVQEGRHREFPYPRSKARGAQRGKAGKLTTKAGQRGMIGRRDDGW